MNIKRYTTLSTLLIIASLSLLGNVAVGQTIPGIPDVGPKTVGGFVDLLRTFVQWVYVIFFIIAVLFIIFAAFTYLTAGGDEEKVKKAKNMIIYAVIAIAVALLAIGVRAIVANFLGGGQGVL